MDQITEKINAGIVTFFMSNIKPGTVELHRRVVDKFNPKKYQHHSILTGISHGHSMDAAWVFNGIDMPTFKPGQLERQFDHDVLLFLDVDAVPLNDEALDYYINKAYNGSLIGNIQRSNHIQNNQHVFAAPSAVALSTSTCLTIGKPSAEPTKRSDVGEEYTFAAEKTGGVVPIELIMPLKYDLPPAECPFWALQDGQPVYGRGTAFGLSDNKELFWHNFQSFHEGQQEKFELKCKQLLGEEVGESRNIFKYSTT